jgi:hypothetical protein
MTCHAELATLRAELAEALARAERAEVTAHLQAQALVNLTARLAAPVAVPAPLSAPPASRSDSVTEERHASRITRDANSVTHHAPSVTEAQKAEHRKAQAAARSRAYRLRKGSVTGQRDGVTPYVTQEEEKKEVDIPPPPSVTLAPVTPVTPVTPPPRSGRLTVTRAAAREVRAPTRTAFLPAEVQALREGWQTLVVGSGRGFAPWPERTSAVLLADAEAALKQRPLAEWLEVFARVPRSPVCRGELRSGRKADVLWILRGMCADGHEPADKLLNGGWTLDGATLTPASPEEPKPEPPAQDSSGDTLAARIWGEVLAALREERREYALQWLAKLRAREVREGVLVLEAPDTWCRDWVCEHYGELLSRCVRALGLEGVHFVLAGEGGP